jgi:ubiquitin-conjugating enzyme E2 variant
MRPLSDQPGWIAIVDRISVGLFLVCWSLVIARLGPELVASERWGAITFGLLAGYLAADFVSGSVHWLADRYFDPRTPVLGPMLIAPFRDHHVDAMGITRHDLFEVSGNNGLATLPLALALWLFPLPASLGGTAIASMGISLGLAIFATNFLHRWAHTPDPPRAIRPLQRLRLVLSPEAHARHHAANHDRAYCVTSGWLNPLLDRYRFYSHIEHGLDAIRSSGAARKDR